MKRFLKLLGIAVIVFVSANVLEKLLIGQIIGFGNGFSIAIIILISIREFKGKQRDTVDQ